MLGSGDGNCWKRVRHIWWRSFLEDRYWAVGVDDDCFWAAADGVHSGTCGIYKSAKGASQDHVHLAKIPEEHLKV
jgi:hypothetical protein